VEQVAVIGLPHEFYGEEVVAVVKLKADYELTSVRPELDALCKKGLNAPSVPSKYIAVDELPASSNGKIQKNKLRDSLLAGPALVKT
jgi:acyl-coenzyme A synthetase/AMP-(fatty) acid ligase